MPRFRVTTPRCLDLQLCCTTKTPSRETLDVWPALPLLIQANVSETSLDDVVAVLKHTPTLQIENKSLDNNAGVVPELASLYTSYENLSYRLETLPNSFFRCTSICPTSAGQRFLALVAVPYPGLPKLLLSAAVHLVNPQLQGIPHSGYILSEAMAICLSMLTGLESPQSCPDRENNRRSPPPYPSRSHFFSIQRGKRIPGGPCVLGRFPSALPFVGHVLTSTPQKSTNLSVARQHSGHVMRAGSSFIVAKLLSVFVDFSQSRLTIGNFHPWRKSVPRRYISFPRLRTSTSTSIYIQDIIRRTISRVPNGSTFYFHLQCEKSLPIQGIFATHRARSAGAR